VAGTWTSCALVLSCREQWRPSIRHSGKRQRRKNSRGSIQFNLETESARWKNTLGQADQAVGGARGEVCEKAGPTVKNESCGNGNEATGFSRETDGATTNPAGV
jgi:hypothetical protein